MRYTKEEVEDQAVRFGEYTIETKCTIRETAKHFQICKSSVHTRLVTILPSTRPDLYQEVRKILDFNMKDAQRRGGVAVHKK